MYFVVCVMQILSLILGELPMVEDGATFIRQLMKLDKKEMPRNYVMEDMKMAKGWLKPGNDELGDKLSFHIICMWDFGQEMLDLVFLLSFCCYLFLLHYTNNPLPGIGHLLCISI